MKHYTIPEIYLYFCYTFTNKFRRAIDSVAPIKEVRANVSYKPWFDFGIISAIQKRDKIYSSYKNSGLEIDKD